MDYLKWNEAISSYFFNPDRSGSRVFLYVTEEVITEIGAPYGGNKDDFIAAVKAGPPWNTRHGWSICQQALQAFENWRTRVLDYPPYLGYLALFVLADWVNVPGFARHAYYPGLRSLLDEEPETGMYPSFHRMHRLWDDLAVWSNQDRNGDLGIFEADIVGEWMHVGLPRAQTLLTDKERDKLPNLFEENGLDPRSPPSDLEIAYLLANEPHRYLRPYTKGILRSTSQGDSSIRAALIEILLGELEHWDGSTSLLANTGELVCSSVGNLRLAMVLDLTARTARFFLRCRSNREYPDEGLQLISDSIIGSLYCYEDWQGWSTPLFDTETRTGIFDASRIDWQDGLCLNDNDHSWKVTLSKRSVRVMVSATSYGFDGFVEESQIPQGRPFYLLAHNNHTEKLETWGSKCCEDFSEINLSSSLPNGWRLYSIDRANSDALIRDAFPFLAFPTVLRIQFIGGLKVRGNQYFTFALPQIALTGAAEVDGVFCNKHRIDFNPETGVYTIPDALGAGRLIIEAIGGGECLTKRSLYALETVEWRDRVPTSYLDKFGRHTQAEAAEKCAGAIIYGFNPPDFDPEVFLPPSAGHRVYFIGRNPGEIIQCPNETIPEDWQPVWAIMMEKRGKGNVIYCGRDPANETPGTTGSKTRKQRRLWKEILWYRRKRITDPSHSTLRALWQRYKEVARRVG